MSAQEWESLCDGCGLCCQQRLEDEHSGEIALSHVVCRYLDLCNHQCTDYQHRHVNVPTCIKVTPENVRSIHWLPHTCAYGLVAKGFDLPGWHHLKCGDRERVHTRGPSMRGELVSEVEVKNPKRGPKARVNRKA